MTARQPPSLPWRCLDCLATGLTTGTQSGADQKHVEATGHGVTSHLRGWATEGRAG